MAPLAERFATGPVGRVMGAVAVMVAVLMVILDMTVVNVAVPHMMGALGATPDQITWVLTSYIVAEAVMIPVSGFLAERFGRRRVLLASVTGFVVFSALCGQAQSLAEMVVFRLLQGAFGASVVPLSQATMVDSFRAESRGKAMALWGVGIMLGPIFGPTVGGFITDALDWRWVFYINIPIGLVNLALIYVSIKGTEPRPVSADWLGAALLAIGVGSLQTMLDRGHRDDWLQSPFIVALAAATVIGLVAFVVRSMRRSDAILRLDLLRDRNFATSTFMIMAFSLAMFGTIALQPILLEHLLDYPASTAGLMMAPRGIAVAAGMVVASLLVSRVEPRRLVFIGLALAAFGSYFMTWYNLDIDAFWIIAPGLVQGLGMGMIFVPLSTLAYRGLPADATDRAASIFNLARTVGGSIGISIAATLMTRQSQASWNVLGGNIDPFSPELQAWLAAKGLSLSDPFSMQLLGLELTRQSVMLGFLAAFHFICLSFLLLIPFVLILKAKGPIRAPAETAVPAGA